ncbi:lipoprotein N-acyltransferase Lnb domain-containing protein [Solilutibacter tolerans]|nr:DUF4105 domain-containing protein [Lysobacter tolerans]
MSASWAMRKPLCAGLVPWLLLITLLFAALPSLAAPRIGVMTMQPGEVFWERFGHDAIVVDDPARSAPISYNFGFFDLEEEGFVGRFVRGEMEYALVALPLSQDLEMYRQEGRGVSVQWLDLTPEQAESLAQQLEHNARPENARYRYDYFRDNCATRVRDALDRALGGALGQQLASRSQGNTYRSEATRLSRPAPWMWLGFEFGLGPNADRPLSRWEEAFIPMRLADSLREARTTGGTPLVIGEEVLLPHRLAAEPQARAQPTVAWTLAGIVLGIALWFIGRRRPRIIAGVALGFWLLCGVLGTLMLFLWLDTSHWAAWRNHNLLLVNPLAWLLLPGAWAMSRGRSPSQTWRWILIVVTSLAVLALPLSWVGIDAQFNTMWLGLLLPVHLAFAVLWVRKQPSGIIN